MNIYNICTFVVHTNEVGVPNAERLNYRLILLLDLYICACIYVCGLIHRPPTVPFYVLSLFFASVFDEDDFNCLVL